MDDFFFLTENNVKSIIGKKIEFIAPGYKDECYKGIATINSVDISKRNPILCTYESGDNLKYAVLDNHGLKTDDGEIYHFIDNDRCFSYSDTFREIRVRVCE